MPDPLPEPGGFLDPQVTGPLDATVNEALTALLRHGTDLLVLVGADARIRFLSPAAEALLGAPAATFVGRPALDLVHPGDLNEVAASLRMLLADGGVLGPVERRIVRADGTVRTVEIVASSVADVAALDGAIVINSRDVTDRRLREDELAFERSHDAVTGLAGEALFVRTLGEQLDSDARTITVLAVGVGDLRSLHGLAERTVHEEVLRGLSERFRVDMSDAGDRPPKIVARAGTATFLVLCADSGEPIPPEVLAELTHAALKVPLTVRGLTVTPEVSVGVVPVRPLPAGHVPLDTEAIVDRAYLGLREARAHGHGATVVVDEALVDARRSSALLARDLRTAIASGELALHYQPQIALNRDRIVGVEALARWTHPSRGPIPPPVFIGLAEQHGLIGDLGSWILREAVGQAATWQHELPGPPIGVAVNISALQFSPLLPEEVAQVLAASGLDPALLTLEVTESTVMDDTAAATAILADLKALGVRLSVDDFGTGYSSLAYLRRFPLDELKVDRSFVVDLAVGTEGTAIVAAVMAMAHALGLTVVAEGVEDDTQLAELRRLGVETAQGYLFARPAPADDVARQVIAGGPKTDSTVRKGSDIVVADDAPEVLQLVSVSLAAAGYTPHTVADGTAALAAIRARRPMAAVLDMEMPGLRGSDVCRLLRADPATAGTTIVILSAHASPQDRIEAFRAGADEYVVKPVSPRDIVARTAAAVQRRERGQSQVAP